MRYANQSNIKPLNLRFLKQYRLVCLAIILLIILILWPQSLLAQSSTPVYWRYDAPGRLSLIESADVNRDGIEEFIVVADGLNLILVGSDGRAMWPIPYSAPEIIRQVLTIRAQGYDRDNDQIVIITDAHIILVSSNGEELWQRPLATTPGALARFATEDNTNDEILIALSDGRLFRFNNLGQIVWEFEFSDTPADEAMPQLSSADLNRDGLNEIIYTYLNDDGFSKLIVIGGDGLQRWERSNSGAISAMTLAEFDVNEDIDIAIATSLDRVYLYNADGERVWPFRSPNKPITAMTMAQLDEGPALVVGTSSGTVIAYDRLGRRLWSDAYGDTAENPVLAISAPLKSPDTTSPVALAVILASPNQEEDQVDIILLDSAGRQLEPSVNATDALGSSKLVDINDDGKSELLLTRFATIELVDPGIGARQYFEEWDYRMGAKPESVLVEDIDLDGEQELLIGTTDGTLHALDNDGNLLWTAELGGVINQLDLAKTGPETLPSIIAIRNDVNLGGEEGSGPQAWIEVLRPDGRLIWNLPLETTISSILVGDINESGPSELLVGTTDGQVIAYSLDGDEFWQAPVNASVDQLILVNDTRGTEIIVGTGANSIDRLNIKGTTVARLASYFDSISSLDQITRDERLLSALIVGLGDGTLRSLSTRGNQNWQTSLGGLLTNAVPANDSIYVSTDEEEILRIDYDGDIIWRRSGMGRTSSMFWGDLDGDVRPDIAAGNRDGQIYLLDADGDDKSDLLDLASEVFKVAGFRRVSGLQSDLVAVTENGIVQLFRSEANRPPLLVNPNIEVSQGEYGISISVIDVENDPVTVSLEIFETESGEWLNVGTKVAASGEDTLFWSASPPEDSEEVMYRFVYDDGSHQGQVNPANGPAPIPGGSPLAGILIGAVMAISLLGGTVAYVRRSRSPSARVNRFLQKAKQEPEKTLLLLDEEYNQTGGSPDFLLNLANRARQEGDDDLANLADGLYLLSAQPESALPIISSTLNAISDRAPSWRFVEDWIITYQTAQYLLTAPTITELSLLFPQLQFLVNQREKDRLHSEAFASLLPPLSSLGDSDRVDLVEDRIIYLNEAVGLLKQLRYQSREWPPQIENAIVLSISNRWVGLAKAGIEELHGKAQIIVKLVTKQIVPEDETTVALNLSNIGRSPAEQMVINIRKSPTFACTDSERIIPILSPGRHRQVQFRISPKAEDRFRIVFDITYNDRHGVDKSLAFADMVNMLPRNREYSTVANPYAPGMPLRSNSTVFFGREELFSFIKQNATNVSNQNVLILIGQRRTGKTSTLLHLEQHLPKELMPVYIDCQSLGVTPGMPSLLHDIAWSIYDAVSSRGFDLEVPELIRWQADPTGFFQREFLESVRCALPDNTVILLIFDEFEVFEDLVRDHILPPTLLSYLRHLMQHGKGLNFIFSGTHRLEEMGSDYWSVLFNAALYKHISYLNDDAARRLIRDPVDPNIIYDDLAIDKILRVTAGHPYFLQLVCYTLVNNANKERDGYITISDVNSAIDEMLRLGEVHFAYLWQRSTFAEKALLAAASRLMDFDTPFRPADLVRFLEQYNIYMNPSEVTTGLNRLVQREIMREYAADGILFYELRIGLVGLWVVQNKSLSHLYESGETKETL